MLQRPSVKLPSRRLSTLSKTPIKPSKHNDNNNENDNTTNKHITKSPMQIESINDAQKLLISTPRKNNNNNNNNNNFLLNISTQQNYHPSPRETLSESSFNIHEAISDDDDDDDQTHDTIASLPKYNNNINDNNSIDNNNNNNNDTSTSFITSSISNIDNIQCMIRIRPILSEIESRGRISVSLNELNNMITIDCKPKEKSFTFDHVGPMHSTQESVFQTVGKPITNACLSGYNGTIFAYGQTGSGKTFTILGDLNDKNSSKRGLMPRVFDYLFSQIQRHRQKMGADRVEYLVKCSCLEIYNERIQDLLEPDRCNLQVREDIKRGVIVEGLSYKICETANDALDLINVAGRNRRVSETTMNKESSRSHLMFTLLIECRITDSDNTIQNTTTTTTTTRQITSTPIFTRCRSNRSGDKKLVRTRTSRFNLVDLAGSERQSKTKAKGERLREAGNINKSLTVLGHVMKALVQRNTDDNNKHRHIHYRDSKLTHLLKDSLGGNSLTFMIACISPSSLSLLESLSTLQFASRAKYIKNKAQLNEDQSGSIQVLKSENLKLINEVEKLKKKIRHMKTVSLSNSFISGNKTTNSMEVDSMIGDDESINIDGKKWKDTLEILERENYGLRREREKCKNEIEELGKVIDKKQQFVMSLKMQLKLREIESVKLRNVVQEQMGNGEKLRNEIIERYEQEEKERKMLLFDPSYLVEEHIKNMELQQQSEQMMDFIHRFIDDKDNKFRYDQYIKWKNTYQILVDENEELRQQMKENQSDSLKLLAVKQKMVEPKIEEYENKILSLNTNIKELENNNKTDIEEFQQKITTLELDRENISNSYSDLQNNFAELESKIQLEERKYSMEKQAIKHEYEKQLENMRQGAVRALDSNNEHTMQLKMEMTQFNAKMEATEKELLNAQSQYRQQTKQLQIIENDLNNIKQSNIQLENNNKTQMEQILELNIIINNNNNNINSLNQTITQMAEEQNANQSLLKESQNINQELEDKIGEKHSNINRLEAELETITQQFTDLKLQYESLQDDHQILNDVQSTLEYQKQEIDNKLENCYGNIKILNEKNGQLCSDINDKNNIIERLNKEVNEKMVNKDEMVSNLNKKNEELLKTISEMNNEINTLKEELNESQNEMLRKDIDIEALKREMNVINGQLMDYKSAHNELENKYSLYIQKYKQLQVEMGETQHKCDTYNAALIEKNIKLQRLLEDKQLERQRTDTFEQETRKRIKIVNQQFEALQNEIKDKQIKYDMKMNEWECEKKELYVEYNNDINGRDKKIEMLESDINILKKEMSEQIAVLNDSIVENEKEFEERLNGVNDEYKMKCDELNDRIVCIDKEKCKLDKEYGIVKGKYENEKCKLEEKEKTLQLLQKQLSRFDVGGENGNGKQIESQMSQVFEQFNSQHRKLNDEISELNKENGILKSEMDKICNEKDELEKKLNVVEKQNKLAKESFEMHKKNMCLQLERAHKDIQLRQQRSERLIKTFEQRLELRSKQNTDYRDKIDQLTINITNKNSFISKQNTEIEQIKDQLKRCQLTVTNAQSLNETLLNEKAVFDNKLEERDIEIENITNKHNKIFSDLITCNEQRENAIQTSKRMRLAEEKAYNDMFEWKTKYNNVQETSQRIINEMDELKKRNDNLTMENSKLAGHHNAQQRINHLLNLKKECEKLKKDKKQLMNKISVLQKNNNMLNVSGATNMSAISTGSLVNDSEKYKEQLTQMSATKDEMSKIITNILVKIRNIGICVNENDMKDGNDVEIMDANSVDEHMNMLNVIECMINKQNNEMIKLKRDVLGLKNDLNIRDEQIKLLQDKIVLTPKTHLQKKVMSRLPLSISSTNQKCEKRKRRSSAYLMNEEGNTMKYKSKSTSNKVKRHSTDTFNFE